ncbi:MAG: VanW family protein, partial [Lachnospiraceae bacterium]|nr:VanW family protein [Lachnospiraceae bacterium]
TANGYKTATAYENGRSVDSVGGGVCQIATTLYNAALYAELDIVQRQNHSMTVAYVDHSRDAAIAGTYKDIKISNPYETPIYVEGYTSGKKLTFKIYGQETRPENREVKFESKTLQWISPGDPIEQPDPTLQPGQRVQVQSSHTGIRSELYKCVYVDGALQERTLLNKDSYNASKAIYHVGPALPVEPAPAEGNAPTVPEAPTAPAAPAETQPAGPGAVSGPGAVNPSPSVGPAGPGAQAPAPTPAAPSGVLGPGATQGPQ